MSSSPASTECDVCGAPFAPGLAACAYCKTVYAHARTSGGIACPRCGDVNLHGNAACVSCRTPLVQACLFCGQASGLDSTQCQHCGEAFAGAAQRKAARDAQQKEAQMFKVAEEGLGVLGRVVSNPGVSGGLLGVLEELVEDATKS